MQDIVRTTLFNGGLHTGCIFWIVNPTASQTHKSSLAFLFR